MKWNERGDVVSQPRQIYGALRTFINGALSKYCWNLRASRVADMTTIFKSGRLSMTFNTMQGGAVTGVRCMCNKLDMQHQESCAANCKIVIFCTSSQYHYA